MDLSISMPKFKTPKKILIALLATLILWMGIQPPAKADAFVQFAAVGAVEVGVLAFWGGAVLVATVGVAVGLDPEVGEDIQNFGKAAFTGANDAIKKSIEWSVSKMKINTSSDPQTYAVQFTPEVKSYLQTAWNDYYSPTSTVDRRISVSPSNKEIVFSKKLTQYASVTAKETGKYLGVATSTIFGANNYYLKSITNVSGSKFKLELVHMTTGDIVTTTQNTNYYDAYEVFRNWANSDLLKRDVNWIPADKLGTLDMVPSYVPTVITPALPANIPDVFTVPAPVGTLNPAGDMVTLANPTIGYPNRVIPANPWDVAVGYPAIPGDITSLSPSQTISKPADIPAPSVPTVPDVPDVTGILGWLNAFWTKFMQMLKDLFIPSAINFAPISNIWATRFPAIQSITAALQSLTVLNYEQSPPKFNFTISGKSYTFIDLTKVPPSWMNLAKMFIRISIWSAFIFMVLREWRPRPHLG